MAKQFDPHERELIAQQLHKAGLGQFTASGLRAVRIEDLCKSVGIAKGSFYNFFASKEDLFMAIAEARDATHRNTIISYANGFTGTSTQLISGFFDFLFNLSESDPIMDVLSRPGELDYLLRKLPPDRLITHQQSDAEFMKKLIQSWSALGLVADAEPTIILELSVLMVCLITRRAVLPEKDYLAARNLLRELFIFKLALPDSIERSLT